VPIRIPSRVANIAVAQFDILNSRAAELRAQGRSVISLGQAVPGFGPPKAALDAAAAVLPEHVTHLYSADAGLLELREAVCGYLSSRHAVRATPQDLIITAGGNQAVMLALMTLVDAGDDVLLPAPYFANHEMAIRAVGATPIEIALTAEQGFSLRWDHLASALTARTRAAVICTPSNPTGAIIDPTDATRIVAELARRNIVVISDEAYMDFVYGAPHWSLASLAAWRDNVVLVGTFSKSFGMTGWRVGYMLADAGVTTHAVKVQDAMIICATVIAQRAVGAALRETPDYTSTFLPEFTRRRDVLSGRLARIPRLHWVPASGGFFAFVRVDGCTSSVALASDILERAHVVTIPGATFGKAGEGYLRFSYGTATSDQIDEAFDRLEQYFRLRTDSS